MVTLDQRKIAHNKLTNCHDRLEAKLPIINSPGRVPTGQAAMVTPSRQMVAYMPEVVTITKIGLRAVRDAVH